MLSFARLTNFILLVLSISLVACATSTGKTSQLDVRDYGYGGGGGSYTPSETILKIMDDMTIDVEGCIGLMGKADLIATIVTEVNALVAHVEHAAACIAAIAEVEVSTNVQAELAGKVLFLIKIIVEAFIGLTTKFGPTVMLELWAKVDVCIHLLLIKIDLVVHGVVELVAKL
ncbi:hypothetical protein RhiJN_09756 [Ceratobasidium sp. AG-Ba]|nr:hypothetical protein RhiJN_09756 [Ceratobasidium sp. AG-Ba]QRW10513.1 hypothetical protein RhiLY_09512 [Ceratobasidium sp. AG-Ba]